MLRVHFTKAVLIVLSINCIVHAEEDGQKPLRLPTENVPGASPREPEAPPIPQREPDAGLPPSINDERSTNPRVVEERIPRQPPQDERSMGPAVVGDPSPRPRYEDPPAYRPQPRWPHEEPPTYRPETPYYRPDPVYTRPEPPYYRPEPNPYQPPYTPPPSQGYWEYETQTIYVGRAVANERFFLREAAGLDGAYRGWEIVSVRAVARPNSPRTTTVKLVADGRTLATQINPRTQINLVPSDRTVLDKNVRSLEMVILGSTIIVDNIEIQVRIRHR